MSVREEMADALRVYVWSPHHVGDATNDVMRVVARRLTAAMLSDADRNPGGIAVPALVALLAELEET